MRLITAILILLICWCSDLTSVERELSDYWVWDIENNGFKEKGYIELLDDRTYVSEYSSSNPTEAIQFKKNLNDIPYWREKDGKVCIATSWEGGSFFRSVVVKEEFCLWDVVEDSTGKITLEFNGGFTMGGVIAKKRDKNAEPKQLAELR